MWKQQVRNDSYYLAGSLNTRYYVSELLSKMYSRQSITESMFLPSMISPAVHNYTEKNKTGQDDNLAEASRQCCLGIFRNKGAEDLYKLSVSASLYV